MDKACIYSAFQQFGRCGMRHSKGIAGIVVKEVIRIKCRNCGELNKEDAKFCCECGTSLITKKYCPRRGEKVEADSKFCNTCGQTL